MKNAIQKFFTLCLFATLVAGSTFAAKAANLTVKSTVAPHFSNINKITVAGNVELLLIQDVKDTVKVYNLYYPADAIVYDKDGTLRISAYNRAPLQVVVHLKNLSSLTIQDKARVKTAGNLYLPELHLVLRDQSAADINAHTVTLMTDVSDHAQLNLSGATEEHDVKLNPSARLNTYEFTAKTTYTRGDKINNMQQTALR